LPDHLKNNPYAGLSEEEMLTLYEEMLKNPEKYSTPMAEPEFDKDGNPIIDAEGGATIQPEKGFVVKSKDQKGEKIFLNMTSHPLIDPVEQKELPDSDD
jgi:PIH1 N-terminal domain